MLRGRAGLRASSSGKWLTAYIYLPLAPSGHIRRHSIRVPLLNDPQDTFVAHYVKGTNRFSTLFLNPGETIINICVQKSGFKK